MSKRQSSFYMGNEFNGYGTVKYLRGTQNQIYPPVSQENVKISPNFQNYLLNMLGSMPVLINPQNANPILMAMIGSMASVNQASIVKTPGKNIYFVKFDVISNQDLVDGAYPLTVRALDNEVPLSKGVPDQWVPYGEPQGAKWKYHKNGHYVTGDWVYIEKDKAWYYLDSAEFMTVKWKEIKNKWYYFNSEIIGGIEKKGHMALGWMKIENLWYYFKEEESAGYMVTGWREIKGTWYYFKTQGEAKNGNDFGYMYSEKWLEHRGEWYYFNKKGEMVTSELLTLNGKKYFFKADGTMAVDEIITDPKTKKTYKADGDGVCREIKNGIITVKLKDSMNFVKIRDGKDSYYGGNQSWYYWEGEEEKTNLAINGGCGTVASANIVAYLAKERSECAELYKYGDYTIENYTQHMKDMYEFVTPKHIGNMPLGVWPISMMENGVKLFAADRGISLSGIRNHKAFNKENVTNYIKEGLEKNSPVAMLIGTNKIENVTIHNFDGNSWTQGISLHWVTITELEIDEINNKVKVKVSTWGGWATLELDDFLEEWIYAGVLYFE